MNWSERHAQCLERVTMPASKDDVTLTRKAISSIKEDILAAEVLAAKIANDQNKLGQMLGKLFMTLDKIERM